MAKAKSKKSSGSKDKGSKKLSAKKVAKAAGRFAPFRDLVTSDLGREILADALVAAAAAAAAALTKTRTAQKTGDAAQTASGAVADVVAEAARSFLPASLVSGEEHDRDGKPAARKTARYAHLKSDHSRRKVGKDGTEKAEKGAKAEKSR